MNGWQLMMLVWHHGCNYNGLHSSWKWVVLTKLQWVTVYIWWVVIL